jgi:DNA-binding MarR family transcriptional regulator
VQLPDPTLGLLIIAARHAIRQAICVRARKYRLTSQQFWGLVALRRLPGITPGDLGHWMLLDPPATSRLVAELVRRKLVEVRPDREDRRRTRLHLTEKGEPLAAKLEVIAQEYQDASVAGMSPEQIDGLRAGLRRMVENLARFGESPEEPPGRSERVSRAG